MTIKHHIGDDILLAYAAGSLGEAWSLVVATHLALCPTCRGTARDVEAIGGQLLESVEPVASEAALLARVMQRLVNEPQEPRRSGVARSGEQPLLPQPLRRYVGSDVAGLSWRRLGRGAYHIPIVTGDQSTRARLLRIPAGLPVPMHGHNGPELTLVLTGAFRDRHLYFGRGDVQEADSDLEHQPHADPGEDCICLAVTDAPLRFRSLAARLVQPFIGI